MKKKPRDKMNIARDMAMYDALTKFFIQQGHGPTELELVATPFCSALCGNEDCMKNKINMQYVQALHKYVNMKNGLYCRGYKDK